jgi:nitrate/nitrite transport system ATP-binding protein
MKAFVEIRGVSKGFASASGRMNVLEDVNLEVAEGEFVAIVGYSGSGKTTLMSLLAGLLKPDSGSVSVAGKPVLGPGPDRGVVFQNYSLLPWLTVFENIHLAVDQVFAHEPEAARRARTERYVQLVNLTHARDRKPGQLSGGMRQRVSVARALSMDPKVLLLDEPLGALDALTRGTLQTEIERIWQADRKTVVMITNDVDEAILLADRIIPLSAGPRATLGPAVSVDIERPRDRKALNHHPEFKHVRSRVIEYLLGSSAKRRAARSGQVQPSPVLSETLPSLESRT